MDNPQNTLAKLRRYRGLRYPILSVHLGKQGKKSPSSTELITELHSLVHQNLSAKDKKRFADDIRRINNYLQDGYNSRGNRSVAFFSAEKNLWEVLSFEFPLQTFLKVSHSAEIRPIQEAVRCHSRYLVLLADREKARIFTVYLGRIEEQRELFDGTVPQNVKPKKEYSSRTNKVFRHIEWHLHEYLQKVATVSAEFAKKKRIEFLVLGGHKELLKKLRNHLPKGLREKVVGEYVTELNVPINDVFLHSKEIAAKHNNL